MAEAVASTLTRHRLSRAVPAAGGQPAATRSSSSPPGTRRRTCRGARGARIGPSRRGRSRDRRRLDRRDRRCRGASGAAVVSFGENRGLRAGIAAGYREASERGYAFCGRVDADGQHPATELARLLELVKADACDVAVGSRFAEGHGYDDARYVPSASRRFGIGLLQKAMHIRLGRPFLDPTSGMAAVNAKAMRVMAEPYASGAPEVEALLRLKAEGLRVEEVPSTCGRGRAESRSCRVRRQ